MTANTCPHCNISPVMCKCCGEVLDTVTLAPQKKWYPNYLPGDEINNETVAPQSEQERKVSNPDNEFATMQFPGKDGSNIHEKTTEEEINEIAQWLNNEKYSPEVNLWAEVAKEFHFDKPFHESVVKAITQRLIQKGFKISQPTPAADTLYKTDGENKENE